jgi:hypothetical protein
MKSRYYDCLEADLKLLKTSSIPISITIKTGKFNTDAKSNNGQTLLSKLKLM